MLQLQLLIRLLAALRATNSIASFSSLINTHLPLPLFFSVHQEIVFCEKLLEIIIAYSNYTTFKKSYLWVEFSRRRIPL